MIAETSSFNWSSVPVVLSYLKACGSSKNLELGRSIHARIIETGINSSIKISGALVDMYAKCGSMVEARRVYDSIPSPNVVPWTSLILGYAENGEHHLALETFARLKPESIPAPNSRTYLAAFKACSGLASKESAQELDQKLVKMKSLETGMAIVSYARRLGVELDVFSINSLVDMFGKCGSLLDAKRWFDEMPEHTTVSWNSLLLAYADNGEEEQALELFSCMNCRPNSRTFVALLKACSHLAARELGVEVDQKVLKPVSLERGMALHSEALKLRFGDDTYFSNSLLDLYARCGCLEDATRVFLQIPGRTVVSWNSIIQGFVECGENESALETFQAMQQVCEPNSRTFAGVLQACSSSVDFSTGKRIHGEVCRRGLQSELLMSNLLMDFYGKCGSPNESRRIFESVWRTGDSVAWNSILSAYTSVADIRNVVKVLVEMIEENVLITQASLRSVLAACSHAGLVNEAKVVFEKLLEGRFSGVDAEVEDWNCFLDMVARAGHLDVAANVVKTMPVESNLITSTILMGKFTTK